MFTLSFVAVFNFILFSDNFKQTLKVINTCFCVKSVLYYFSIHIKQVGHQVTPVVSCSLQLTGPAATSQLHPSGQPEAGLGMPGSCSGCTLHFQTDLQALDLVIGCVQTLNNVQHRATKFKVNWYDCSNKNPRGTYSSI